MSLIYELDNEKSLVKKDMEIIFYELLAQFFVILENRNLLQLTTQISFIDEKQSFLQ